LWNVKTGEHLAEMTGHSGSIASVDVSPDGKRIVTAGSGVGGPRDPGEIKIWDAATGRETLNLKPSPASPLARERGFMKVAWCSGGARLISAAQDEMVRLFDTATGEELSAVHVPGLRSATVSFSPDGKRVFGERFGNFRIWDATTGEELRRLDFRESTHSPDGQRIVSFSHDEGDTWSMWDVATGKQLYSRVNAASESGSAAGDARASPQGRTTQAPNNARPPGPDKYRRYAESMIKKYDTNGDGKLSGEELKAYTRLPRRADRDGDGVVTVEELVQAILRK
jgi:WD40 repeat protein